MYLRSHHICVDRWVDICRYYITIKELNVTSGRKGVKCSHRHWPFLLQKFKVRLMISCVFFVKYLFFFFCLREAVNVAHVNVCTDRHFKSVFPPVSADFTSASHINTPVYPLAPTSLLSFPYSFIGSGFQIINFHVIFGAACVQITFLI